MNGPTGMRVLSKEEVDGLLGYNREELFAAVPQARPSARQSVIRPDTLGAVPAQGGLIPQIETNLGKFSPYDFETRYALWEQWEDALFQDYERLHKENPFAYLASEYLLNEVFGNGFHFEGPGAQDAEDFFYTDDTRSKLLISTRQAIILGNGYLDLGLGTVTGKLKSTEVIDASTIRLNYDPLGTGKVLYTQIPLYSKRLAPLNKPILLNSARLLHQRIKVLPNSPYGMSLFRPNLWFLRGLEDICGDIPAAMKRIAYAPLVAKLDFSDIPTSAERDTMRANFEAVLHKVISASTNFVIDKKHDLDLAGSGGGAGARLLPVVQLIEPLIAVVLFNFGIPLGMLLQSGANRSILREQSEGVQRFIGHIRQSIKRDIELRVIPSITSSKANLVWDEGFSDWIRRSIALTRLYEWGIVSREFLVNKLDIEDDGKTFFDPQAANMKPEQINTRDTQTETNPTG